MHTFLCADWQKTDKRTPAPKWTLVCICTEEKITDPKNCVPPSFTFLHFVYCIWFPVMRSNRSTLNIFVAILIIKEVVTVTLRVRSSIAGGGGRDSGGSSGGEGDDGMQWWGCQSWPI